MKKFNTLIVIAGFIFLTACNHTKPVLLSDKDNYKVLYVFPDGSMQFKGRQIARDNVIIYDAGQGKEKAAVRIHMPLYNDAWRDSILVERVFYDVVTAKQEDEGLERKTN
jgi:hypothetical protein